MISGFGGGTGLEFEVGGWRWSQLSYGSSKTCEKGADLGTVNGGASGDRVDGDDNDVGNGDP